MGPTYVYISICVHIATDRQTSNMEQPGAARRHSANIHVIIDSCAPRATTKGEGRGKRAAYDYAASEVLRLCCLDFLSPREEVLRPRLPCQQAYQCNLQSSLSLSLSLSLSGGRLHLSHCHSALGSGVAPGQWPGPQELGPGWERGPQLQEEKSIGARRARSTVCDVYD